MQLLYPLLNVLQGIFLAAWSALWISLALVARLVTFSSNVPLMMARRCWAPALVRLSGARLVVDPLPELDWSRPHIFAMNHQSMLDIACAFAVIPANLRFVAKKVLRLVPFLGWYMWATGMVFVDRSKGSSAMKSLIAAGKRIREGVSILAYPEGTRSRTGAILPFKKGVFVLALEAGVPIVPVVIEGSGKVLPSGSFRLRAGVVRMRIGQPIEVKGKTPADRDALMLEVRNAMIRMSRELGGTGEAEVDGATVQDAPAV